MKKERGVPFKILSEKLQITWVSGVLLCTEEFQIEPLAPNAILYDTSNCQICNSQFDIVLVLG